MNNSGERPCDVCSIDGLIISIIGTLFLQLILQKEIKWLHENINNGGRGVGGKSNDGSVQMQ